MINNIVMWFALMAIVCALACLLVVITKLILNDYIDGFYARVFL